MIIDGNLKFGLTNWIEMPAERHEGTTGYAIWKVQQFGSIRVRMVEYSKEYLADHWCDKGHIIFCVDGEMTKELKDGREFCLRKGMSYQVGDNSESHRSRSENGVTLFIVD